MNAFAAASVSARFSLSSGRRWPRNTKTSTSAGSNSTRTRSRFSRRRRRCWRMRSAAGVEERINGQILQGGILKRDLTY